MRFTLTRVSVWNIDVIYYIWTIDGVMAVVAEAATNRVAPVFSLEPTRRDLKLE